MVDENNIKDLFYIDLNIENYNKLVKMGYTPYDWVARQINTYDFSKGKVLSVKDNYIDIRREQNVTKEGYIKCCVNEITKLEVKKCQK